MTDARQERDSAPSDYEPGSQAVYATGTYTIIGRILEVVTGGDYQTVMRNEIFAPRQDIPVRGPAGVFCREALV